MSISKIVLLVLPLSMALVLLILFAGPSLVRLFADSGFSQDKVRAYARKYIESRPEWPKEVVIKDVEIQKMNLHDREFSIAKVSLRLRGDFDTWQTLYLVSSPDHSAYLINNKADILSEVDRDGYAQVSQRLANQSAPTPTSTVIYREYPTPTKAP